MRPRAPRLAILGGIGAMTALLARCSGLSGLPPVPDSVTAKDAGLDALARWDDEARRVGRGLDEAERERFASAAPEDPVDGARFALDRIARGEGTAGLPLLARALEKDPGDLVLGNVYRMEVVRLKRQFLSEARSRGERMPELPGYLRDEPSRSLERIAAARESREIRLQIALAHVDRMVLSPALEIKAPASIDAVHALTAILEEHPHYVPALVGRGLNYLYRPRNLVWPERPPPPHDAASRDLSLAVAVGARVGGASARLRGILLAILGDGYAREGRVDLARSWWALARGTSDAAVVRGIVGARMGWRDVDVPDRLDEHLDERMADMDHPASDLSFLWSARARGPS